MVDEQPGYWVRSRRKRTPCGLGFGIHASDGTHSVTRLFVYLSDCEPKRDNMLSSLYSHF